MPFRGWGSSVRLGWGVAQAELPESAPTPGHLLLTCNMHRERERRREERFKMDNLCKIDQLNNDIQLLLKSTDWYTWVSTRPTKYCTQIELNIPRY